LTGDVSEYTLTSLARTARSLRIDLADRREQRRAVATLHLMKAGREIVLSDQERTALNVWLRLHASTRLQTRAKIVLLAAEGKGDQEIARLLGASRKTVALWRGRFLEGRLAGIEKESPRGKPRPKLDESLLDAILKKFADRQSSGEPWTIRALAKELGVSASMVQRVCKTHRVGPLATVKADDESLIEYDIPNAKY
jgi:transposase